MSVPTEEQERRNAAEHLRRQLWAEMAGFAHLVAADAFKRDKPEPIAELREYLDRIERLNGWAKA